MKKHTLLALALSPLGTAFANYPATIAADSPLAYFRFEEDPGASFAIDSSGNGNDSLNYADLGSGEIGVPGAIGKAIRFNGDGAIVTGLTHDPSSSDFSMELMVKLEDPPPGTLLVLLSNRDGTGLGRSNALITASGQVGGFVGGITSNSGINSQIEDWQHIVYTYEKSTATLRIFVNGVEGTPNVLSDLDPPLAAEAANGEWIIGAHKLLLQGWVDGLIDEVAIYDKRLDDPNGDGDTSDSVVGTHYEAYREDTGLFKIAADRIYADPGEPVELTWTTSPNMTSLEVDQGVGDVLAGLTEDIDGRFSGGITVNPTESTTYTLSGTSTFESDSLTVDVIVGELPVIETFVANPTSTIAGLNSTLSWNITNADTAQIDNGIGELATNPGFSTSGTQSVVVNGETTYLLTASNGSGSVTAEVTVTIADGVPNLIGHWKIGETPGELDGTTLISETGELYNGLFVGNPSFDTADPAPVPGGSTASLVFDGNDSWVDIQGWAGIAGKTSRTVAFWFKGPATQTNNFGTLVSWGTNTTGNRFDTRVSNNSSGRIRTEVAGSGSDGTATLADDTWHHAVVVLTDDGSPNIGEVLFYIDGQLDTLSTVGTTDIDTNAATNVRLGASRGIAGRSLTGKMDDIRIYNRALDANEVLALFQGGDLEPSITSIARNESGSATIRWIGKDGVPYLVEYSKTLEADSWIEVADSITTGVYTDNNFAPGEDKIFYRIQEQN
ncbi:LamG-like jellyroll fold domain-containing protein [Verrucomicrobiaceae bacterium 227]